ncbi:MAG: hypothetical protein QXR19_04405 [Candidatus Jordarchaeaceae archaeon]
MSVYTSVAVFELVLWGVFFLDCGGVSVCVEGFVVWWWGVQASCLWPLYLWRRGIVPKN